MIATVLPIAGLLTVFLAAAQDDLPTMRASPGSGASSKTAPIRAFEAVVDAERLELFDRPVDQAFITGQVRQGDRVRVRADRIPGAGWLAIEPLSTSVCWIEKSSLDLEDGEASSRKNAEDAQELPDQSSAEGAWVCVPRAVIRSGNSQALHPGPPQGTLPKGTMVHLVDRPALAVGQGPRETRWLAIVPPPNLVFFVHADGVRWQPQTCTPPIPPAAEVRASYEEVLAPSTSQGTSSSWPPEIPAELERIDATFKAILASQPIDRWRFDTVRADYQSLLKRAGDRPDLEDALRTRLARITQHEQAARSARTIESILAKSHRRDSEVAAVRRELARSEQARTRAYDAVGFIQPSARKVDGHKVFALIGAQGSTIAYLDVPAGLDTEPFLAHRVGVRGRAHFSEDLGTRLITVRDLENVETRK